MNLSEVVTRVADDCKIASSRSGVSDRIKREINRICQQEWESFGWSWRWRNYRIVTDTDYATGTVTATNGSRSVTGSGTTFAATHVNWHIYFPGDPTLNWYKVRAFTSTTAIELDVPYQGTTGSGKSYVLRHFDYVLPTEPWDLGSVTVTSDRRTLSIVDPSSMDMIAPTPLYNGYPTAISIYSSDSTPTTYSTGTVSGTIDTTTLTGSGTAWLSSIYPGDSVTIGSYVYTVRSVDSDTQINLYNHQQVTSSAATYSIKRQFGRIIRVMWPSSVNHVLDIRALRNYSNLVNDNDTNEIIHKYPNPIILKVSSLELKSQNDKRSLQIEQDAEIALMRARAADEAMTHKQNAVPLFTYRSTGSERSFS